jgi:histidyl-tRNA synthetase
MEDHRIIDQVRGTRIQTGSDRRQIINIFQRIVESYGYTEIVLPVLERTRIYRQKIGNEVTQQMYTFLDKKGRELCLRPEGTATIQRLAREPWWERENVQVWYETKCFRYERPQAGRYREFTQLGIEVLRPKIDFDHQFQMIGDFLDAVGLPRTEWTLHTAAQRGLAYYTGDGFEVCVERLGAQKQIIGGGRYAEGFGFAVGLDRLMLALDKG